MWSLKARCISSQRLVEVNAYDVGLEAGGVLVGDEVKINLEVEAAEQSSA